ncbi:MAG: hypothetical protein ACOC9B_04595 [Chloroflexota bacterium]
MENKTDTGGCDHKPGDSFGQMVTAFGQALGEIFNDPELKAQAREFGEATAKSAQALGRRFKDEEVRDKFRQAGEAAEQFGYGVTNYFKKESHQPRE